MIEIYYFKLGGGSFMLEEKIIKDVSENILQLIDDYELSVAESKVIFNKTIEILENIAIIPMKRRCSRKERIDKIN